jgi:4-hydroxybenzoate polyprenyltransferase
VAVERADALPVCVDLDGTLVAGDLLWESFASLARERPLTALRLALGIAKGRAHFKRLVAERVSLDPATLPYRTEVVDELEALRRRGVPLVLATSAHRTYAEAVARHLGCFDEVIASDGDHNLSGRSKADALVRRFGERGFRYAGNDWVDVPVWRAAAGATIVAGPARLVRRLRAESPDVRVLAPRRGTLRALVAALRSHQWAKNALVFVPLVAGHDILQLELVNASVLAFVAFCMAASGIYIVNDIVDISADRSHPRKARRPFASGELGIPTGLVAAAVLLSGSVLVGIGLSWRFAAIIGLYVALTSAYSLGLKRIPVADVFTLTGLYVLRIVAGGVATGTLLTSWLLAFALFFFLGLAFVKRYVELNLVQQSLPGRGYGPEDGMWMHAVGTSAGYMAVLVLALYVNTPEVTILYSRPDALLLLCPLLLFWLTRLWFRAGRRLLHDDPVVEALKDPLGYVVLAASCAILLFAAI